MKKNKKAEILSSRMQIKRQSFHMDGCVRKLTGRLDPGIVVGNSSSSLAKDRIVLLQFSFFTSRFISSLSGSLLNCFDK